MLIAWVTSLIASFFAGYYLKLVKKRVEVLEEKIEKKIDKKVEGPESVLIDPLDPVKEAIYEAEQQRKRLNGIQ